MIKKTVLWILVILWAFMIFMFSAQIADDSDKTSLSFGEKIVEFAVKLNIVDIPVSENGEIYIKHMAEEMNNFIRKTAHFGIYLIFGVLVFMLSECYKDIKNSIIVALFVCFLYAVSDEIHQLFVPGRAGMIKDVFLDFSGSAVGIFLINIKKLILRKQN